MLLDEIQGDANKMTHMTTNPVTSPVSADTALAASRIITRGFLKRLSYCSNRDRSPRERSVLGPKRAALWRASDWLKEKRLFLRHCVSRKTDRECASDTRNIAHGQNAVTQFHAATCYRQAEPKPGFI